MNRINIRPIRFIFAAVAGLIIFFSNVLPAAAIGTSKSALSEGETQLNEIQKETDKVAGKSYPAPGMKETQAKSQKGLNGVQGAANKDKMLSPSDSRNATTVKEEVGNFLENLTGNN
ncbi:MAG: hypothetical protein AAF378_03110 [Cyanobacteria bacterium P01_A01_bin.84]